LEDKFKTHFYRRIFLAVMAISIGVIAYGQTAIRGSVPQMARHITDNGSVSGDMTIPQLKVYYAPTSAQSMALQQLLADQRTRSSPQFHKWLTPEQFGEQFGISRRDEANVRGWLEAQGFTNISLSRSRTAFSVSATAAQAQAAFHTQIHTLTAKGESHYSNVTEIALPSALASVIRSVRGLDDFKPHSNLHKMTPQFTWGNGNYEIAPGDIATIYDIQALYAAGITGNGITAAVVGQNDIALSDIAAYRSGFNLPAITPTVVLVPGSADPGSDIMDEAEGELDLEMLGAVAPNANLVYVNSTDAYTSLQYAIEQNIAPVVSMSYASCEAFDNLADQQSIQFYIDEANSQGMTIIAAAGDEGPAACDGAAEKAAQYGLSVASPANQPGVTGVGGTSFTDPLAAYFASTNSATGGSALSYIPEIAWNLTAAQNHLEASGGGASIFFAKPAWQEGPGVPVDGQRDVPDVAMFAGDSALNDSTAYAVCLEGDCASGPPNMTTSGGAVGGTSAATPVFAGIVALLNNYLVTNNAISTPGLGNINPTLYLMAENTSNVFHPITQGNNIVPCVSGTPDCTTSSFGYSAGPGYNQVTGLGSVDAFNLVHAWENYTPTATNTVLTTSETPIVYGTPITLTAKVVPTAGSMTPTGSVTFYSYAGQISTLTVLATSQLDGAGTATLALPSGLAEDVSSLQAAYSGSAVFAQSLSQATTVYQPTSVTLSTTATQIMQGSTVTLTANVSGVFANTTGTVTFFNGTTQIGSAALSDGTASLTTSTLPVGTDSITAAYSGTQYYAASSSQSISIAVTVLPVSTTTTLAVSASQSPVGTPVTLTATVTAAAGSATGTVNFLNGTTQIGTASISNDVAILSTSTLPLGANSITAAYAGTIGFASSTSAAVSVAILQPSFTLGATHSTLSVTGGTAAATTLTITPVNGFSSTLNFACSGLPAGSVCTFGSPAAQNNGTSTVSLSISTQALTAAVAHPFSSGAPLFAILPCLGILSMRRRKALVGALQIGILALAFIAVGSGMTGCGGGGGASAPTQPTTPTPVTSTITVTATASTGEAQTTQLSLTVN
jgi:hypothetical protein